MDRSRFARIAVGLTVLALSLASHSVRAEEWFDAYERGLNALKQKKAARAVELLERAIRMHPEPGTNILTYGTNRLDEYFPYLHLAEAQLLAGNHEAAQNALARSTARGKEPAAERGRIAALVGVALEKARVAAAPPPTAIAAAPPPTTVAPAPPTTTTTAAAAAPPPTPPATRPTVVPAPGTLDLASEPSGASVLVDGRFLGTTPLRVEIGAGPHQVRLRKQGFVEQAFPVRILPGQASPELRTLAAAASAPTTLAAMPGPGPSTMPAGDELSSLVLYSDPPGAAVFLDDEMIGTTDPASGRLVKSGVKAGRHALRMSRAGRSDAQQAIDVAGPGPTTVRAALPAVVAPPSSLPLVAAGVGLLALLGAGLFVWARRRTPATEPGTLAVPREAATGAGRRQATAKVRPASPGKTKVPGPPTPVSPPTAPGGETHVLSSLVSPAGVGERFGEYLLLEPLGKGGMASVFKAERDGDLCALKRPLSGFLEDPEFMERFLREAEIGRTLHHPNIIRIFERGDVQGVPFFTMELVEGETLQARMRREGAFASRDAAGVVAQVAEALDYAHLKGVVHRDLKPSNIMILSDGGVKVMDYGIARARRFDSLTVTGSFMGTPDYVAPETAEGKSSDGRSDLYSLGVVFYELITGQRPFVADTPFATVQKHCTEPPMPPSAISPSVPREIEAIILKLLSKNPSDRYPGAEELLIELRAYLNRAA